MDHKREMLSMGIVMVLTMVFAYFIGLQDEFGLYGVGNILFYSIGNALTLTALLHPFWSEGQLKHPRSLLGMGCLLLVSFVTYRIYAFASQMDSPFPSHWSLNQGSLVYILYVTLGVTLVMLPFVAKSKSI